ncbi:MAG: hypothetical protein RR557_07260 [Bacilli bacterium]
MPEIYLCICAILAFIFCKEFRIFPLKIFANANVIMVFIFFSIVSLFSILGDNFNIVGFYGRYRALFWFLIAIFIGNYFIKRDNVEVFYQGLLVFCLSSILFSCIDVYWGTGGESVKQGIPIFSFVISIVLLLRKELYSYALLISVLFVVLAFFSFWRQNYIIALYGFILTFIYSLKKGFRYYGNNIGLRSHLKLLLLVPFFAVYGLIYFWNNIINFLFEDEQRYIQSVGKILSFFENVDQGGGTSEQTRIEQYRFLLDNFIYFLLPNGLVDDSILSLKSLWGGDTYNAGVSIVRDSSFGYFTVVFGLLISFFINILFTFRFFNGYKRNLNNYRLFFIYLIIPILVVYFVDGLTMTQMQKSIYFGFALALIFPYRHGNLKFC